MSVEFRTPQWAFLGLFLLNRDGLLTSVWLESLLRVCLLRCYWRFDVAGFLVNPVWDLTSTLLFGGIIFFLKKNQSFGDHWVSQQRRL